MQPEVPFWIELLRLALTALALLGAWAVAGAVVAWFLFGPNQLANGRPDPITPANAAHPTGGWWWLYPVAFVLALLASIAWPMGVAS